MNRIMTKHYEYGEEEIHHLRQVDPVLGAAIDRLGKVERVIIPDLFTALLHAIISQLISVKAAQTIWDRMLNRFEELTPEHLAHHTAGEIQSCGLTMKKAISIHQLAQLVSRGEFRLEELHSLPDAEVIKRLTALQGVGQWTAEMLLLNSMERCDVVSWGDIAIRRGMMKLYQLPELTKASFDHYRRSYSPYGSVASIYLWVISYE